MYSTQGIVLKKSNSRERDAIFIIFTKEFGKIKAYAQGVKRENAKLKGHLEHTHQVNIQFVLGKNGERLTHAELINNWPGIQQNFKKFQTACYMLELIDTNCLLGEKDEPLWDMLISFLVKLNSMHIYESEEKNFLHQFENSLLEHLGYSKDTDIRTLGASVARPW